MPRSTSLPSEHSAAAFAFATGASGELSALLALLGALAYSLVHAGVSYPSDVAASAALGVASGVLALRPASGIEEP